MLVFSFNVKCTYTINPYVERGEERGETVVSGVSGGFSCSTRSVALGSCIGYN